MTVGLGHRQGTAEGETDVDGLQQGGPYAERLSAVTHGRRVALELRAAHIVHDVDGSVLEHHRYGSTRTRRWIDPVHYHA